MLQLCTLSTLTAAETGENVALEEEGACLPLERQCHQPIGISEKTVDMCHIFTVCCI